MLSTGLLKAREICKRQRTPPHSCCGSTRCQQLPDLESSFSNTPLPVQYFLILKNTLSSISFSLLTNLLSACYFNLRWWKGSCLFLCPQRLAWHTAIFVTGEVAQVAEAQNCFLCEYFCSQYWFEALLQSAECDTSQLAFRQNALCKY